ncbi:DUF397 domain-containing protein [Haloechinothrix salitolerans]|uniref:DUF397 domain-containing protein n=1 Tax=Haloechinothrix salitolerans TaxID=926830 RepID=A0ABW2C5B9_9PSEU
MTDEPWGETDAEGRADGADDKAALRDEIDLSGADWHRPVAAGDTPAAVGEPFEIAFVPHTDGLTYVALRQADTTLIFTPSEWRAFVAGAKDGEFDTPW